MTSTSHSLFIFFSTNFQLEVVKPLAFPVVSTVLRNVGYAWDKGTRLIPLSVELTASSTCSAFCTLSLHRHVATFSRPLSPSGKLRIVMTDITEGNALDGHLVSQVGFVEVGHSLDLSARPFSCVIVLHLRNSN